MKKKIDKLSPKWFFFHKNIGVRSLDSFRTFLSLTAEEINSTGNKNWLTRDAVMLSDIIYKQSINVVRDISCAFRYKHNMPFEVSISYGKMIRIITATTHSMIEQKRLLEMSNHMSHLDRLRVIAKWIDKNWQFIMSEDSDSLCPRLILVILSLGYKPGEMTNLILDGLYGCSVGRLERYSLVLNYVNGYAVRNYGVKYTIVEGIRMTLDDIVRSRIKNIAKNKEKSNGE